MRQEFNIKESIIYQVWKDQNFKKTFQTEEGVEIVVLDCGTLNDQLAGPDFLNARVRIGNITYVGDIEIDIAYTDWKAHGHNIDSKYSKVVLHATLINKINQDSVYTRDGRKIPSICLSDYIDKKIINDLHSYNEDDSGNNTSSLKCSSALHSLENKNVNDFLVQMGIQRFERKRNKIYQRLKELQFLEELGIKEPVISYELSPKFHEKEFSFTDFNSPMVWKQLLYEQIFDALGYNKNRTQMFELAKNLDIKTLQQIEKDGTIIEKYEAALFKVSGLFPESLQNYDIEERKYWERLNLHWASIQPFYDSKFLPEEKWNFFRLRPQNFPTVRLAGGARMINEIINNNMIEVIIKKVNEIINLNVLIGSLRSVFIVKSSGYWKSHFIAGKETSKDLNYFIGASRADEIVINIILPFLSIYFDVYGNKKLSQKVMKVYSVYAQTIDNKIVSDIADILSLQNELNRTIITQGILELFRSLCSKNKCLECEIGRQVFN